MFAALVVLALCAFLIAGLQWRYRRAALAKQWLHAIVAAVEAVEAGEPVHAPNCSALVFLGSEPASRVRAFFEAANSPAQDRERTLALGDAVLRELRDIATHRDHTLVSRA
jgi:hypothetical protein